MSSLHWRKTVLPRAGLGDRPASVGLWHCVPCVFQFSSFVNLLHVPGTTLDLSLHHLLIPGRNPRLLQPHQGPPPLSSQHVLSTGDIQLPPCSDPQAH